MCPPAAGAERKLRVVEAATGGILRHAFEQLLRNLREFPEAVAPRHWRVRHRALGFRLHSRLGCALHVLLRMAHDGHPYRLFQLLVGNRDKAVSGPSCLHDECAHSFLGRYPSDRETYDEGSEALAVLRVLAELAYTDIAQLESRHAAIRRLTFRKSLQTWVACRGVDMSNCCCRARSCPPRGGGQACKRGRQSQEAQKGWWWWRLPSLSA